MEHACPSIRYRVATDIIPGLLAPPELEELRLQIEQQPAVRQIVKKQKESGVWGGNLLGVAANKTTGVKDVGTVPQYRRLIEMGLHKDSRPEKMASRVLYRLVSRDEDPKLLFALRPLEAAIRKMPREAGLHWVKSLVLEFSGDTAAALAAAELGAEPWIREVLREAASAALAHGGHGDDPRVRGAAHKILNQVSAFVRSELAENPFVKSGRAWVLHPQAYPPTVFSLSLLSSLPAVQRERAGLVERLGVYLSTQPPKKAFTVPIGKKLYKPNFLLLGDPIHTAATGEPDDLPLALYWMETLARLGLLQTSTTLSKVWGRLSRETDKQGIWHPKNLRALPKGSSPWAYHMFPLESDFKNPESRQTDVTFRMALIARLAGWGITHS